MNDQSRDPLDKELKANDVAEVARPPVSVLIHPSQFPHAVEASLRESLRTRRMNHAFHYDTPKQTLRWLRVHEAFSPARKDPSCLAAYENAALAAIAEATGAETVEIVSIGCGGGQKEAQLIRVLRQHHPGRGIRFVPVDVSAGLALIAREAALKAGVLGEQCAPFVMDLVSVPDWAAAMRLALGAKGRRIVTFFGMMPNFTPGSVLPQLAGLMRPGDVLLVSANLAPGPDYAEGVARILPQYNNGLTREWLLSVLLDLGVARSDGEMEFQISSCPEGSGLLRIEAAFCFRQQCTISYAGEEWVFERGERFQLFFSYRHSPERVREAFSRVGIEMPDVWMNESGEEGVFLGHVRV